MMVYLFFTTKVMQSLINAIFAGAIGQIFKDSEIEYIWITHLSLYDHRHVLLALPPPLNLPFVLYRCLGSFLMCLFCRGRAPDQT